MQYIYNYIYAIYIYSYLKYNILMQYINKEEHIVNKIKYQYL